MRSQLAIWRQLSLNLLWGYPWSEVGDQTIYKRLETGGSHDLEWLFAQVSTVLPARLN